MTDKKKFSFLLWLGFLAIALGALLLLGPPVCAGQAPGVSSELILPGTAPDGSALTLSVPSFVSEGGAGEAVEVICHNPGLPDRWTSSWIPGPPLAFKSWTVAVPANKVPLLGSLYGCRLIQDVSAHSIPDYYVLAADGDFHYPCRRNGIELFPQAGFHRVFPGDTLYARFVPKDDPFELRMLSREITSAGLERAKAVLAIDYDRIGYWPWLQRVLGWYSYPGQAAMASNTPPGQRLECWLLSPSNFIQRWGANPGGVGAIAHWYGFGTRQAGVSLSNEHYDSVAAWLISGVYRSDPVAVDIALTLARQQGAYGVIDCAAACPHKGKYRTESGDLARGTQALVPSWAKEYDKGEAALWCLFPHDYMVQKTGTLRITYLLTCGHEWQGAGGARNLGHFLENLRHWWVATGDDRLRQRALSELDYAMAKVGNCTYFPEALSGQTVMTVSAGEGLITLGAARWWAMRGGQQHQRKLDQMLHWYEDNCVDRVTGRAAYFVNAATDPATKTWSGDFQGLFWLTTPGLDPVLRAQMQTYMFTHYEHTVGMDAAFGGEGPGWEKWKPMMVTWGCCTE